MNLQGIVSVSGKPGLWRALAQNKTGFILESLDAQKTKLVVNLSTAKLAALDEITIFSYDEDILLKEVLQRMKSAGNIPDAKADGTKLRQFFREVAPDHDEEKVYASDMKKIISWFNILKPMPLFDEEPVPTPEPEAEPVPVEAAKTEPVEAESELVEATKPEPAKEAPKAEAEPEPVTEKAKPPAKKAKPAASKEKSK